MAKKIAKALDPFDTSLLHADLKGRSVRGGAVTLGAQGVNFVINLGSTAVLARLLTPGDFGLVAMVTALTGFVTMFKDAGLSMATVQRDTVNHEQISTLFWINVGLSFGLMVLMAALAPAIAWFYGEPRLVPITLAVASVFIFSGLTVQHQALLRRQMKFGALAWIQIFSGGLAMSAAVVSALSGAGYWALIVQMAIQQMSFMVFCWIFCRWVPGRPRRGVGTRAMLKFGGQLTGFNFVNYFARNADNVLIGNVWGGGQLGLYTEAYGLLTLPLRQINGPISAVAIPALSRLQNDPAQFRDYFIKTLNVISFITFPLIAWIIICRLEIILLILGQQWLEAVPIFGALSVSAFFQPIGNITGVLYVALGRGKRMFQWGLIGCSWLVISFFIGLPYGAIGVAWAYSIAMLTMAVPCILYAIAGTPIKIGDFIIALRVNAFATVISGALGFFLHSYLLESFSNYWNAFYVGCIICISYIIVSLILDPKNNIIKSFRYMRLSRKPK